ncbi:transposase [Halogeometricum borinquense DSM 11551]|uniref:Transposase n=2 Tax=Halogeometricum borinquense TaxID=60847 RepID=E4NWG1_HALBP|nr:helix-turn-helix domain-containing protein [Halogeometricum borinquense]ADQ69381.1 transposase [Halogeometricum borinquense DSM 11551]ELY26050.1 transposase [Halogeometricum borinquense DSM 11551]RYJ13154.1 helix-turn-helix domain-containing protein [Halogeometricum borinquense]
MVKLDDVDPDELRRTLAEVDSAKEAKRLVVALDYLDDVPVSVLADRYGIPRSTLYYWLDRFETESIEEAITDEDRPGRPRKLDEEDRNRLRSHLDTTPREYNYDADEWTPELVREHVEHTFGVTYSVGHIRRLLRDLQSS